ncbi:hypothetical protein FRB99_007998 [Tulasnella sp. 403]|nr:hypothetical protein FRB99_007998 [Tulasnella sp. 403]
MSALTPITPARSTAPTRAELLANSPHYSTTRRHSLYGTEDRIIIDPGSRIWKVGFSGEGRPRDVFSVKPWSLGHAPEKDSIERMEEERMLELELQDNLRRVFFNSLLADPKSRKIIVIEPPLMPVVIKDIVARILFHNLEVIAQPS